MPTPEAAERAIRRWFSSALLAVDPEQAIKLHVDRDDRSLVIDGTEVVVDGRVFVAAIGKAAQAMTRGAVAIAGDLISGGVIITKDGHLNGPVPANVHAFETAHPIPDHRCQDATEFLLNQLAELRSGDVVLALISGGGSALMEAPVDGVSLAETAATTDLLLRAGAPIQDLNAVRVPLSKVKGGGLRSAAPKAKFVTLLLSDVLGNNPSVIASGPTVQTHFTGANALAILERYRLVDAVPFSIRSAFGRASDMPSIDMFANDLVTVIGDNVAALGAFMSAANNDGVRSETVIDAGTGEARELAATFVDRCEALDASVPLGLGGGEATVTVRGNGHGGRNTEFALAAAMELERRGLQGWSVASLATDGQDAMTGVAGAIASVETLERSRAAGIDPEVALAANDSLSVFNAVGGAVDTGPTGTNVNDLYIAIRNSTTALL